MTQTMSTFTINGTGSAIADYLFSGISIHSPAFQRYMSRTPGDGGLEPGKLVLSEDFEEFAGKPASEALAEIVGDREPDSFNLGGPAVAALINTAQLLHDADAAVSFHSTTGNDDAGARLERILRRTPVAIDHYERVDRSSPYTYVLSDPEYNNGAGERTFVNNIGAAWQMTPDRLGDEFFAADIVLFGGTALVPNIHDSLSELVPRGKRAGCLTVVSTVYDFRNEKRNPNAPWPLGRTDETYRHLDLLIADREEALRLSGRKDIDSALAALTAKGLTACVVTHGTAGVWVYSDGRVFAETSGRIPVSHAVEDARACGPVNGDTTGCGDNFVGGVLFSLALQIMDGRKTPSLRDACAWGVASGDYACFYMGGTYLESTAGEKYSRISTIRDEYVRENASLFNER